MNDIYKKIEWTGGRVFVVGDIHGEYSKFKQALENIFFDKSKDLMISVGDLIDRGEDSVACLRLANEPWFECVKGNHEQMAFDSVYGGREDMINCWMQNGGGWYASLSQTQTNEVNELIREIELMPLIIEANVNGKKVVICHANHNKDQYELGSKIHEEATIWDRSRYNDSEAGESIEILGADLFVFGHTPVNKIETFENQVYIDTGAVFGRALSVIEL